MSIPSPLRAVLALVGFSLFAPLVLAAPEPPPIVSAEEIARTLSQSFRLRVSPPAGRGTLVAIVSDETPQLGALTARHKDLSVVERPKAYLVEMAEVLRAGGDSPQRTVGTLVYETVMPGQ